MSNQVQILIKRREIVVSGPGLAIGAIKSELAVFHPKYYALRGRRPKWDGYVHFSKINPVDGSLTCKIGLLSKVKAVLNHIEADTVVTESKAVRNIKPIKHYHWVEGITLDPLQEQVCELLTQHRVAVAELGTSSGKTEVIANSAANYLTSVDGPRVMVVVPSRGLLHQTKDRIIERLPKMANKIGILGDGEVFSSQHDIVVTTFQSVGKDTSVAKDLRDTSGLVIIDEGHHSISPTIRKIIQETTWDYLWAVSGKVSFFSEQDILKEWELRELLGPPVFSGSVKERQCQVEVIFHQQNEWQGRFRGYKLAGSIVDEVGVTFKLHEKSEWMEGVYYGESSVGKVNERFIELKSGKMKIRKDLYGIYHNDKLVKPPSQYIVYHTATDVAGMEFKERNEWAIKLTEQFHAAAEPYLVTCLRPRHAYKLYNRAVKLGHKVRLVTGEQSGTAQQSAVKAISDGTILGIFAVYSTVSEGIDIPRLRHLIKLDMVTSEQVLEQTLGRLRRKYEGKVVGTLHVPWDHQQSSLLNRSQKTLLYYERSGVSIKRVTDYLISQTR